MLVRPNMGLFSSRSRSSVSCLRGSRWTEGMTLPMACRSSGPPGARISYCASRARSSATDRQVADRRGEVERDVCDRIDSIPKRTPRVEAPRVPPPTRARADQRRCRRARRFLLPFGEGDPLRRRRESFCGITEITRLSRRALAGGLDSRSRAPPGLPPSGATSSRSPRHCSPRRARRGRISRPMQTW